MAKGKKFFILFQCREYHEKCRTNVVNVVKNVVDIYLQLIEKNKLNFNNLKIIYR